MPRPRKSHPGTLEQRGSSYRVILYFEGKRHSYTIQTTDRATAEDFARDKEKELCDAQERRTAGLPDPDTFGGFLEQYKRERLPLLAPATQQTYGVSLDYFERFFVQEKGNPRIDKIRPGQVTQYMSWRRMQNGRYEGPVSSRTVQKDRAVLHAVFEYAVELGDAGVQPGDPDAAAEDGGAGPGNLERSGPRATPGGLRGA